MFSISAAKLKKMIDKRRKEVYYNCIGWNDTVSTVGTDNTVVDAGNSTLPFIKGGDICDTDKSNQQSAHV